MESKNICEVVKEMCKKENIEYVFITGTDVSYSVIKNSTLKKVVKFINDLISNTSK